MSIFDKIKRKIMGSPADFFLHEGNVAFDHGDYQVALANFASAAEVDPGNYAAYMNLGATYDALRRYKDAIKTYQMAIDTGQDLERGYYNLGVTYCHMKRWRAAIEALDKSLALDQTNPDAWQNKGYALHKLGQEQEALECIRQKNIALGYDNAITMVSWKD